MVGLLLLLKLMSVKRLQERYQNQKPEAFFLQMPSGLSIRLARGLTWFD